MTSAEPLPQTPFDIVSQNLKSFGALSVQEFLTGPIHPVLKLAQENSGERKPIDQLYQTCRHVFGQTSCLRFEFIIEEKQCVLTISRPAGATRSYKSQDLFESRVAAREHIGALAVSLGALEFIMFGDSDAHNPTKGAVLAPLDSHEPAMAVDEADSCEPHQPSQIQLIEDCCRTWRAGRITPQWFLYSDAKNGGVLKHGAALRIQLSPHVFRIYSTPITYASASDAREGCAATAMEEDILEYIKHGNGQLHPMPPGPSLDNVGNARAMSLQGFYDTLPQPFPEPVGDKTAAQIGALSWMNNAIQAAHGSRLDVLFAPLSNNNANLHGYILRLERLGSCKTYLVDPVIEKRSDAKAAVCLLAMSQGIGAYLRDLQKQLDEKLSVSLKKFAHDKLLHLLGMECRRIRPDLWPQFEFQKDRDAFGCTLKVDLSPDPSNPDIREYTVSPDYRTKADAKAAVACEAAQKGVIELFRFGSEPPPPGYVSVWDAHDGAGSVKQVSSEKRKELPLPVTDGQPSRKKRKKGNKGKPVPSAHDSFPSGSNGGGNDPLQGSHAPGPNASVSAGAPSDIDGRPRTQNRTVVRHAGGPAASLHAFSRSAPPHTPNFAHPHLLPPPPFLLPSFSQAPPFPHLPLSPSWNINASRPTTAHADGPYYPALPSPFARPSDPPYYPPLSHGPYYPDPYAYSKNGGPPSSTSSGSIQTTMYRTVPATNTNKPTRSTNPRLGRPYQEYPEHHHKEIELYYGEKEEGELNMSDER